MRRSVITLAALVATLLVPISVPAASASTGPVASASTGPALRISAAEARAALTCHGDLATSRRHPVLFIHGTSSSPEEDFGWNWSRALDDRHWAHCLVRLPHRGMQDVQVSAEYVVWAIRSMAHRAGRDISIVGHSQGGMVGRWALKYWPDTRTTVEDYVGLAASNHGTRLFNTTCALPGGCSGATWQQSRDSRFMRALNHGTEAWPAVDYTEITTEYDEVVVPATSGWLTPGPHVRNVHVQSLCPGVLVDHLGMSYDNATWAIALDALTHRGPAVPSRVDRRACSTPLMPGVDPLAFPGTSPPPR